MAGWKDRFNELWQSIDVDVRISTKDGNVNATTSGTTGRPSVAFDFGSFSARIGDYQIPPVILVGAAAFLVVKLL